MTDQNASHETEQRTLRTGRLPWWGLTVILAGALVAIVWTVKAYRNRTRFTINTCLRDASGLKEEAPVRLAGVDVGYVSMVRPQPQNDSCPVRVEMAITSPYEPRIPNDSLTSVETAGVLGAQFMQVDVINPSGSPVPDGGTLPTREIVPGSTVDWQKLLERWIDKCGQRLAADGVDRDAGKSEKPPADRSKEGHSSKRTSPR